MLLDANILLYAVDKRAPQHRAASDFMEHALNGTRRVALPWQSIVAFVRISTHPRISDRPLTADEAWAYVQDWLDAPVTWIPAEGALTARAFADVLRRTGATGNLVPDASLAAIALEHGLTVVTHDSDFSIFAVPTLDPVS